MEYEFLKDPVTGIKKASFSFEHQVVGHWLESELSQNSSMLQHVLEALDLLQKGKAKEKKILGKEFTLTISAEDIIVQSNASIYTNGGIPEELAEDVQNFDEQGVAYCGLEDFSVMLKSWAKFN